MGLKWNWALTHVCVLHLATSNSFHPVQALLLLPLPIFELNKQTFLARFTLKKLKETFLQVSSSLSLLTAYIEVYVLFITVDNFLSYQLYMLFSIRNLAQGLVPKVPYFCTSNNQFVVLKVP